METNFKELLNKFATARIDFKNFGNNNDLIIIDNFGSAKIYKPDWLNDGSGRGTVVESSEGFLDLELKCVNSGLLKIWFRGIDYRDKNKNRFPICIDYTNIKINNDIILEKNKLTNHDEAFFYQKNVEDGEILKVHVKWLPFNSYSVLDEKFQYMNQVNEIISLKQKISLLEKQLKSVPQLSCTSFGYATLGGKLVYRNLRALTPDRTILNDMNGHCEHEWFTKYLKYKFPDADFKINIFSVSNAHDNLMYPMEGKKLLYSIEDLNYRYLEMKRHFDKYALDYVDLAMGFDLIDHPKYLRFPFWIMRHFPPTFTDEDIENKINSWNSNHYEKTKQVAAIASHDNWGTRTIIDNDISKFVNVTYAGRWKKNTADLQEKYHDNKNLFLNEFKFNLCAENLISEGYVSEKIFDAINCDCIPLYAGGGNYFEPKVINSNAVLRWDASDENIIIDDNIKRRAYYGLPSESKGKWVVNDDRNADTVELFKNIISDEKSYNEFKDQDVLLESASKYVINKFHKIEKHFERLIYG